MTTAADRPDGAAHRALRGRRWVGRVGWPLLAVLGVLVLVWTLRLGESTFVVVVATSALGLLLLLAWPILVAALVSRRHRLAVAAAALVAAQALIAAPLLPTAGRDAEVAAGEPVYSLTSANLSVANPDPAAAGRAITQEPADPSPSSSSDQTIGCTKRRATARSPPD